MRNYTPPKSIRANIPYAVSGGEPLVVIEPPEGEGNATRNFTDELREMTISNARLLNADKLLETEGFTLLESKTSFSKFNDPKEIRDHYYPESEQILKAAMGAYKVIAFDHNIRVDGNSDEHRKPAGIAHIDLTENAATRILQEQLPKAEFEKAVSKRFAFVNVWRPLYNTVYSAHLAFCAASSTPNGSLLKAKLRYKDRTGELFYCAYHKDHNWFYFPRMTTEEILLLKNYDSCHKTQATRTAHTAIVDPTAPPGAPQRQSIEVRLIALFRE